MPPKRIPQQAAPEPPDSLNSPFRYAEENNGGNDRISSPPAYQIPAAPDMGPINYLIMTVERMQSRLFFMEQFIQEHIQAPAIVPMVTTVYPATPEPTAPEAPFTIEARVDAPAAATGTGGVLTQDYSSEKRVRVSAAVADDNVPAEDDYVQDTTPGSFPYAGNQHYSTAFSQRIHLKHPRQMGRNDITRIFEMKLKRGYTPADLLTLEDRWATFCRYPAPQHLWATILDAELVKDLCSYFQMSKEKFENCSNSMVALLLQLFVAPRDVSYFIGYLKSVAVEIKGYSAPSFDTTLPVATFTTAFNLLYSFLAESVQSSHIQPVVVGGGDNPDTVYKIYLKGLGVYGTYIKRLIDQNKLPKLFSHKASVDTFVRWTEMVVTTIQVHNNKLEELSVFVDAREAVLRGATVDLLQVADYEASEIDSDYAIEDVAVLCPLTGETKRVYPCTTTCLGNICKRSFCRNSHDRADLISGVNSLKIKIDAVIDGGYKFLAPVGPSPSPSHPVMRSPARNPAR